MTVDGFELKLLKEAARVTIKALSMLADVSVPMLQAVIDNSEAVFDDHYFSDKEATALMIEFLQATLQLRQRVYELAQRIPERYADTEYNQAKESPRGPEAATGPVPFVTPLATDLGRLN